VARPPVFVVELIREVTDDLIESLQRLIPQLTSTPPPNRKQLEAIVASDAARLLVARDLTNRIIGTLTPVVFPIPTGVRAWIEDVIVDDQARGQGVGAALTQEALRLARDEGARTVDLTSRPSREGANALYGSAGFAQRETNVYRYVL
jgi:ribosomal protein S18 acetylase RimI-like enzyme